MNKVANKINIHRYTDQIETSLTIVGIKDKDLLEIRFKMDEYEVDVEDQNQMHDAVVKLTNNGKDSYHIIVIPGMYGGITQKARDKEMFNTGIFSDQRSISIVVPSLSLRILAKFYLHFKKHKPRFPFQMFGTEEQALKWISENK